MYILLMLDLGCASVPLKQSCSRENKKEPIPEKEKVEVEEEKEEEEEEQAWKRQRTDKWGNRNRSAGSKGEGNSWGKRGFRWMHRRLHDNRRAHRGTIVYRIPVALFKKGGKEQYVHTHVNG